MSATITPRNNGPYIVEGEFTIMAPSGREIPHEGTRVALCRCGGSQNKPFCDATHSKIGFAAAEAAVAAEEGQSPT
jgi:CDGSH-type Zn-finger protein